MFSTVRHRSLVAALFAAVAVILASCSCDENSSTALDSGSSDADTESEGEVGVKPYHLSLGVARGSGFPWHVKDDRLTRRREALDEAEA